MESIDKLVQSGGDDPQYAKFVDLGRRILPMLRRIADVYRDGGFDAVASLPEGEREEFEVVTGDVDAELERLCHLGVVGSAGHETEPTTTTVKQTTTSRS